MLIKDVYFYVILNIRFSSLDKPSFAVGWMELFGSISYRSPDQIKLKIVKILGNH
jgi:hypothetical protein